MSDSAAVATAVSAALRGAAVGGAVAIAAWLGSGPVGTDRINPGDDVPATVATLDQAPSVAAEAD